MYDLQFTHDVTFHEVDQEHAITAELSSEFVGTVNAMQLAIPADAVATTSTAWFVESIQTEGPFEGVWLLNGTLAALQNTQPLEYLYDTGMVNLHSTASLPDKAWVVAVPTIPGDAALDGHFDSSDLIQVMMHGLYETGEPAIWEQGDFDHDGLFNSSDLILALSTGTYESSADDMTAVAAVPEPCGLVLLAIGLMLLARRR